MHSFGELVRSTLEWPSALVIAEPETVLAWASEGISYVLEVESPAWQAARRALSQELGALTRRMTRKDPGCGAPRIHAELLKLGIDVGETSVSKYVVRRRKPASQTWRTPLRNHLQSLLILSRSFDHCPLDLSLKFTQASTKTVIE